MAPDNNYVQAIWSASSKTNITHSKLSGNIETDVAIIGGGITGISAAYHLKQSGRKVVVLESRKIGSGTTGSSTGNLYVPTGKYRSILKKHGQQCASKCRLGKKRSA